MPALPKRPWGNGNGGDRDPAVGPPRPAGLASAANRRTSVVLVEPRANRGTSVALGPQLRDPRRAGPGGWGVVYKARQRSLNRLVALKMIRDGGRDPAKGPGPVSDQAKAAARLRHANILQIYEIGDEAEPRSWPSSCSKGKSRSTDGRRASARDPSGRDLEHPRASDPRSPRRGDHPPRPQAVERSVHLRRDPQDHRLRPGQAARGG